MTNVPLSQRFATTENDGQSAALLEVRDLKKYFKARNGAMLHAVDGINFTLNRGKTLGVVGESGFGK
jgi:ABC-type oligopeptide transport system ATPase subunit